MEYVANVITSSEEEVATIWNSAGFYKEGYDCRGLCST